MTVNELVDRLEDLITFGSMHPDVGADNTKRIVAAYKKLRDYVRDEAPTDHYAAQLIAELDRNE